MVPFVSQKSPHLSNNQYTTLQSASLYISYSTYSICRHPVGLLVLRADQRSHGYRALRAKWLSISLSSNLCSNATLSISSTLATLINIVPSPIRNAPYLPYLCGFLKSFLQRALSAVVLYNLLLQPTFLSDRIFFLSFPTWWLPSQVLRIQNETNKKAIIIPGRERINHQWVPKSKHVSHKWNIEFLLMFFICPSEFVKESTTWV